MPNIKLKNSYNNSHGFSLVMIVGLVAVLGVLAALFVIRNQPKSQTTVAPQTVTQKVEEVAQGVTPEQITAEAGAGCDSSGGLQWWKAGKAQTKTTLRVVSNANCAKVYYRVYIDNRPSGWTAGDADLQFSPAMAGKRPIIGLTNNSASVTGRAVALYTTDVVNDKVTSTKLYAKGVLLSNCQNYTASSGNCSVLSGYKCRICNF